jgi:hypothetical protein
LNYVAHVDATSPSVAFYGMQKPSCSLHIKCSFPDRFPSRKVFKDIKYNGQKVLQTLKAFKKRTTEGDDE